MSWIIIIFFCLLSSFFIGFFLYPCFIKLIVAFDAGSQPIYVEALPSHAAKVGTPTMGGVLILVITVLFSCFLYKGGINVMVLITTIFSFGAIGFVDDFLKLKYKNSRKAMSAKVKMILQILSASLLVFIISKNQYVSDVLIMHGLHLNLGYFYYFFAIFVIVGSSNAFNLTDGLDGLAIFPFMTNCLLFFIIALYYAMAGNHDMIFLLIFYACLIGSSMSFLWFNSKKATIFMGDSGSLAFGAILGVSSIILKSEIPFAISGMIFIIEAISVMLQVGYFKYTKGKRLFLIAPIHHHFEKLGVEENKVVVRFWIFSILSLAAGLCMFFFQRGIDV